MKNPAHGICIREADTKKERRFYSPVEMRRLLAVLSEPCRAVVSVAVLTGMRIGEILALRWKRIDFLHGTIEIAEKYSCGEFVTRKTKSSRRMIPMSSALADVLEKHRTEGGQCAPEALVFRTSKGTSLNAKNLYNREQLGHASCQRVYDDLAGDDEAAVGRLDRAILAIFCLS